MEEMEEMEIGGGVVDAHRTSLFALLHYTNYPILS
jgi:hypothetical protein